MPDRLSKLAALLDSPNDGECLAACRALTAELSKRDITLEGLVRAASAHWEFEAQLSRAKGVARSNTSAARVERGLRESLARHDYACRTIPELIERLVLGNPPTEGEYMRAIAP